MVIQGCNGSPQSEPTRQRGLGLPLDVQDNIRRIMMDEIRDQQDERHKWMIGHLQVIANSFERTNTDWMWVLSVGANFVFEDWYYDFGRRHGGVVNGMGPQKEYF